MSEETGDWLVSGGFLWRTVGRSASHYSGRLVRQSYMHVCTFSKCLVPLNNGRLIPQVLREDGLWLHLPNVRESAGRESRGHTGVQTWSCDSWPRLWRLLVETGTQRGEHSAHSVAYRDKHDSQRDSTNTLNKLRSQKSPFITSWRYVGSGV